MGRIGEPTMREDIGLQQVGELVVYRRPWDLPDRQKHCADGQRQHGHGYAGQSSPAGEFHAEELKSQDHPSTGDVLSKSDDRAYRQNNTLDGHLRRHSIYFLLSTAARRTKTRSQASNR
jgi:hypothetical protein